MERLVTLMPTILEQLEKHKKKWYEYATMSGHDSEHEDSDFNLNMFHGNVRKW